MRRFLAAPTILLLCSLSIACKDQPDEAADKSDGAMERPLVARLRVTDRTPRTGHPAGGFEQAVLESKLRALLAKERRVEVPEADVRQDRTGVRPSYRASVEVTLSHQSAPSPMAERGVGTVFVYIQMDLVTGGAGIQSHGAEATIARPVAPDGEAKDFWMDLLELATEKAFHAVVVQVEARKRTVEDLMTDLGNRDVTVRQEAARELGRRGSKDAFEDLVALLDDRHQDVVLAAVGALTGLRDSRAATALIASTRGRSDEYLQTVIGALRTLGGVEAEAYLDNIATGHPSDDMKAKAERALLEIRARRYGAGGR